MLHTNVRDYNGRKDNMNGPPIKVNDDLAYQGKKPALKHTSSAAFENEMCTKVPSQS